MPDAPSPGPDGETTNILECRDLSLGYPSPEGWKQVVDAVSFSISKGSTLAIVGESGSGKSTIAKALVKLIPVKSGTISLDGDIVSHLTTAQFRPYRKSIQLVFQDPWHALNPRLRVRDLLLEPLELHFSELSLKERLARVDALLESVQLEPSDKSKFPSEFSGGQRQRILIARAMAVEPSLLVCDEPVSALDVSIQAELLDLLQRLKQEQGLTLLFISHDLAVVQQVADHVLVLQKGHAVEFKSSSELFKNPEHPYTQSLIEACPKW